MLIATISTFGLIGTWQTYSELTVCYRGHISSIGYCVGGRNWGNHGKEGRNDKNARAGCFHALDGWSSCVFIAIAAVIEPHALNITEKGMQIPAGNRLELFLGAAIGAITFSGSVIAFGKLSGKYKFRLFQGRQLFFLDNIS